MADDAIQLGIIGRDRTVQVQAQRFANISRAIFFPDLCRRGKPLRLDRKAEVAELIVALVADGGIQLPVGTDLEPTGNVIVPNGKPGDQIDGSDSLPLAG